MRTVGRPNNPKGTRISGITIRVAGLHSPVVSQSNGYFEFDLGGGQTSYAITSVRDNSARYELQEKELLNRNEPVSTTVPKEIVMVSLAEKRAIEEKKRKQIEGQYQKDFDRLETQKAQNEITLEQYRQQMEQLQVAYEKREQLITELSEYFASVDYAVLSEEQARISALLEEGDLMTADSIINAKGSIEERMRKYRAYVEENNQMTAALTERRSDEAANQEILDRERRSSLLIYQELLNKQINMYGDNHPDVATCYAKMGEVYDSQDEYAKAMDCYIRACRIYASAGMTNEVAKLTRAMEEVAKNARQDAGQKSADALQMYEKWEKNNE